MAWDLEETATCDECRAETALRDQAEAEGWELNVHGAKEDVDAIDHCPHCALRLAEAADADEDDDETEVSG